MRLKVRKHSIKRKILISITMFFIGLILSFKYLENKKIEINNKYNDLLLERIFNNKILLDKKEKVKEEEYLEPLIYIYNTHDQEEYSSNILFNYTPTVKIVSSILKEEFNKENIKTIIEERSIKEVLNNNNWSYSNSYKASRIYLDEIKEKYPSIEYFIDVHRDSLYKSKKTVTINDKDYAKILFIVGLENDNYESNLNFTEQINNKLNEKYPNLSKGILKKSGPGVNGVYNQDISDKSILIEIGGYENNIYEVLNATLAFKECYLEVLNER